jgi:hypothetical protein
MKNLTNLLPPDLLTDLCRRTNCSSIVILGLGDLHQRNNRICDIWLKLSLQNPEWNYDAIDGLVGEMFNLSPRQIRRIRTALKPPSQSNGQNGQTKS